jgi:hypothetical protein
MNEWVTSRVKKSEKEKGSEREGVEGKIAINHVRVLSFTCTCAYSTGANEMRKKLSFLQALVICLLISLLIHKNMLLINYCMTCLLNTQIECQNVLVVSRSWLHTKTFHSHFHCKWKIQLFNYTSCFVGMKFSFHNIFCIFFLVMDRIISILWPFLTCSLANLSIHKLAFLHSNIFI